MNIMIVKFTELERGILKVPRKQMHWKKSKSKVSARRPAN